MTYQEFEELFEHYMSKKRDDMRNRFNRVLPTGELIFNRFDKSVYLNCGESSSIYDTSVILGDVEIGKQVWVGPFTTLDGFHAKLTIGDGVSIGPCVMISTHNSLRRDMTNGKQSIVAKPVVIKDHAWIATLSVIGYGVTIGSHCVVCAHSYVNRDTPDFSIVAGTPAEVIGRVVLDEEGNVQLEYT